MIEWVVLVLAFLLLVLVRWITLVNISPKKLLGNFLFPLLFGIGMERRELVETAVGRGMGSGTPPGILPQATGCRWCSRSPPSVGH